MNSTPISGVLSVDKPLGITSMRAVEIVRRRAGGTRTGHAGTLDPLATGVLVIALGTFTRKIDQLMATDKRYMTEIDLSAFTTTDDSEGERTEIAVATPPSRDAIAAVLRDKFTGQIMQAPPAFSAVKLGGRRSYQLARRGEAPTPAPRAVVVHAIELLGYTWPRVELAIHCAKGTYVRSIARDLGVALGTGGTCLSIRRTAVGKFTAERAIALDALPETITQEWLASHGAQPDEWPS